jgi:hypothetical protein
MKMKTLLALILLAVSASAYAYSCRTHTITTPDGRFLTCTTCCYNGNCNTTCF